MNQKSYIKEITNISIWMNANRLRLCSKLLKLSDEEFKNVQREIENVLYKVGVRSLNYAMVETRLDLAFAVSILIQFMS